VLLAFRRCWHLGFRPQEEYPYFLALCVLCGKKEYSLETGTVPTLKRTEAEQMPGVLRDWVEFLIEIERRYFIGMYRYLKDELGVKVPISGTQLNYGSTRVQAELDYLDNHAYWNHPHWHSRPWDSVDWSVRNRALVNSPEEVLGPLATARVAGKPYTVSEYNHPFPNQFAGEGLPMLAAFGRFQGWNGIFQYTYAHSVETEPDKLTGYFDMDVHAIQLVHSPACSAMFKRGLVREAINNLAVSLTANTEIDILVEKLTPQALNFSEFAWSFDEAFKKATGLLIEADNLERSFEHFSSLQKDELIWNLEQEGAGYFTVNAPDVKVFTGFVREREFVFDNVDTAAQLPQRGAPLVARSPQNNAPLFLSYPPPDIRAQQEEEIDATKGAPALTSIPTQVVNASLQGDSLKEDSLRGRIKMKPGKTSLDFAMISLLSLDGGGYLLAATGTMHNTNGEPRRREPANQWEPNDMVTLENRWGDAPVLVEGVPLELTLPPGTWLVYPLDEAGNRRAEPPLRFENEPIRVGPEHRTLWYEIRPATL